jgi:hypothetical protein
MHVSDEKRIAVGKVFVKNGHKRSHVVLKEFRDILTIQIDKQFEEKLQSVE